MAHTISFTPRYWLQAGDGTWYPAPWWADALPLLDAFADPSRSRDELNARVVELCRIRAQGGLVRTAAPNAVHPVTEPVRAVYARAGMGHVLAQH